MYMSSATAIALVYSDYPYQSWSSPQAIVTDVYDSPFGAHMDAAGNIYLVYTNTDRKIKFVKLLFGAGVWTAGSEVNVVAVDNNYNPTVIKDSDSKLWCFFVNHRTSLDSNYYVRVKSSTDDGATWGTGDADLGTALSSGYAVNAYVGACQISSKLYAVYCVNRSDLNYRICDLSGPTWGAETAIHSANYIDDDFDIAPSPEKKLGVVFIVSGENKVYFKENDGSFWSGLYEVETVQARSPQIGYVNNIPHIFYARLIAENYYIPRYAGKSGESFSLSNYTPAIGAFDKIILYNNLGTTKFQDRSSVAANPTLADIFHSESSALIDSIDDCIYFGKQSKFFSAAILLSTAGVSGTVVWEYFNGSNWVEFIPSSGSYNFDSLDALVYFWQDGESTPSDWQIGMVDDSNNYWVRARVTLGFSAEPVGSQIVAGVKADDLVLVREGV